MVLEFGLNLLSERFLILLRCILTCAYVQLNWITLPLKGVQTRNKYISIANKATITDYKKCPGFLFDVNRSVQIYILFFTFYNRVYRRWCTMRCTTMEQLSTSVPFPCSSFHINWRSDLSPLWWYLLNSFFVCLSSWPLGLYFVCSYWQVQLIRWYAYITATSASWIYNAFQ